MRDSHTTIYQIYLFIFDTWEVFYRLSPQTFTMKSSVAIFGTTLLATSIIASPLTFQRQADGEIQRSAQAPRRTIRPHSPGTSEVLYLNQTSQETYSSNWAGAVLIGTGYTSVSGEITVPIPQLPNGANSYTNYCASAGLASTVILAVQPFYKQESISVFKEALRHIVRGMNGIQTTPMTLATSRFLLEM